MSRLDRSALRTMGDRSGAVASCATMQEQPELPGGKPGDRGSHERLFAAAGQGDPAPFASAGLCFCGAADHPRDDRRLHLLERACLHARYRRCHDGLRQALVVFVADHRGAGSPGPDVATAVGRAGPMAGSGCETPPRMPLRHAPQEDATLLDCYIGAYGVTVLTACPQICLTRDALLRALSSGYDRIFLELSPQVSLIRRQLDLVAALTGWEGFGGAVALFHSRDALRTLLEAQEEHTAGEGIAAAAVVQSYRAAAVIAEADRADEVLHPPTNMQGGVDFSAQPERIIAGAGCTLCGACSGVCPSAAIRVVAEGSALEIQDDSCTRCAACISACPENVLSLAPQPVAASAQEPCALHGLDRAALRAAKALV